MAIMLNSINPEVFNGNSAEFNGVERKRADIVTCGRLLMRERLGRDERVLMTAAQRSPMEFTAMLSDGEEEKRRSYASVNRDLQHDLLLFCAERCCSISGETVPADMDEFRRNQRKFLSDRTFLKLLAGITTEIVTPMLPTVMSSGLGWLAEMHNVPLGQTKELDIMSNDIFLFEDDSWGASRSKPVNTLYNKTVTLNPRLRTARASAKWYQLVGNDADLGRFFNAIAAGMYSKITAMWVQQMVKISANTAAIPTNMTFTNTSANWVTAAKRVAMVNGTRYRNVIALGDASALTKALPSGVVNASTVNLDAALATMLGVEWAKYGYLGEYMGINLMPIDNAIVPGTQNTTVVEMVPTDKIWLAPIGGYKPVAIGVEEGSPITIEMSPSDTADGSIDMVVSMSIDAVPVIASKLGLINA